MLLQPYDIYYTPGMFCNKKNLPASTNLADTFFILFGHRFHFLDHRRGPFFIIYFAFLVVLHRGVMMVGWVGCPGVQLVSD